jgi:hypothetical protein
LVRTLSSVPKPDRYAQDDPDETSEPHKPALTKKQGLNRVQWDLRHEGAKRPDDAKVDAGDPEKGPLVLPGTYTVKLTAGGRTLTNPLENPTAIDQDDLARVAGFLQTHLPGISTTLVDHAPCMYTMSPDENFLVDRHPQHPNVVFAAGHFHGNEAKERARANPRVAARTLGVARGRLFGAARNCRARTPGLVASAVVRTAGLAGAA